MKEKISKNKNKKKIKKTKKEIVKKRKKNNFFNKLVFLVLLFSLGAVTFAWHKEKNKNTTPTQIQKSKVKEAKLLLEKVSNHILLPKDVQPKIGTIKDVESLKKKMPSFKKAQNGFKVLIYPSKAIIFDPNKDIVVDVIPIIKKKKQDSNIQNKENKEENNKEENQTEKTSEDENAPSNDNKSVDETTDQDSSTETSAEDNIKTDNAQP